MSAGIVPFGALSPADIARLMQQGRPQVDASANEVPAAIPPGDTGFVPPTAPTMQPQVAAAAPSVEPEAPPRAPLRMFGSLPPQMPALAEPDANRDPLPSLVGSQPPVMPARAPVAPPVAQEDAPAPAAPARPLGFGSLATPVSPAPATTGSVPAVGSPVAAPAPAPAVGAPTGTPSSDSSLFGRLGDPRVANVLLGLGQGLLSVKGFGPGISAGIGAAAKLNKDQAVTDLAQGEYALKLRKLGQEQAGNNATVDALVRKGYSREDASAAIAASLAGNKEALQNMLNGAFPKKEVPAGYTLDASGRAMPIPGGPQDLATIKAQTEAKQEDKTVTPLAEEDRLKLGLPAGSYQKDSNGKISPINPTGTTINMGGEKAYDAEVGKTYAKQFSDLMTSDRNAGAKLNSLALMEQQMGQPGFYSGFGGEQVKRVNQLLGALGIKDPKAASGAEAVAALSNQVALDQLGGSLGAGVSNPDRDFIVEIGPGLGKTVEGNKQLIGIYRAMAQRQQQVGQMARDYAKANGGRIDAGFDEQVSRFANENPLFPAASRAAQAQSDGVSGPTGPGGIAAPRSQADFDALPKGAMYVDPADGRRYRKN